jgi:hypothetical protein
MAASAVAAIDAARERLSLRAILQINSRDRLLTIRVMIRRLPSCGVIP